MSAELLSQETGQKSFSLHGFGGVGKSALALEFAHRHQDAFPIILWFSADTPSNLAQSFSEAAQYLEEKGFDAPEDSKDKLRVFKRLRNCEEDWLLVYDNVEDIELVKSFWPTSSKGSVLIISQNPDTEFLPARRGCSVGPMPIEEGAEFLLSQLSAQTHSDTDRVSANKISEILGGWSLALATAAGVIGGGVWPLEDFERNLRESPTFHLEDELTSDPTSGRTKSIRMVSEMAVSGLSKGAKNVFDLCAFYDSDRILEGLITFDNIDEHVFPLPTNHEFYRAISELRKRSLVEKNERQLRVHRTLQAEAIKMMTPERRHLVFSTAVEIVASKYPKHSPGQLYMAHLWMDCELYLPHVISLEAKYKASSSSLNPPPPEFAELLYNCSWYLMEKNRIDLAFTLARTGHKLCEGPDGCKLILAGICTVLGALHLDKNETKDAYDYLDKARVLREEEVKNKRLAEYDPRLANSYSDLAASATALERYDEAVKLNHRSIKIRQKKPEIQIQMLSLTYHNLGTSLAKLSKVDDARAALEDSLEISKGRSDSSLREHAIANDMRTLYALGNLHLDQGQLSEALSRHEEALKLRLKTLGETHLMTGSSYHKLGSLHLKQGNFKKARELVEKALRAFNQMPGTLGEQARTTYLLSTICRELNDPEAETLKARAGELRKKLNGTKPDLQDTQADYNKLVIFFYR
ncbi:TPR-like protein [Wilcoxina mikolae CBS 423.85]|nr:TPR-like protein [Wilcoxina mikolae CBS 423.85]